jgi:hypothetical protein
MTLAISPRDAERRGAAQRYFGSMSKWLEVWGFPPIAFQGLSQGVAWSVDTSRRQGVGSKMVKPGWGPVAILPKLEESPQLTLTWTPTEHTHGSAGQPVNLVFNRRALVAFLI